MSETSGGDVSIRRASLQCPAAERLINALNDELSDEYPEPGATHFSLDAHEVEEGHGAFLIAYCDGDPIGCGAVRLLDHYTAEIKRMYVVPEARGKGVGARILAALEMECRRLGAYRLQLETGERQGQAVALYARAGFVRIPPFGEYINSPLSVCMEKKL